MNTSDHSFPNGSLVGLFYDPASRETFIYDENHLNARSAHKL
jgi:hypothetical protein